MSTSNLKQYVNKFIDELEIYDDVARGHSYKSYIRSCINNFLNNENRDTAFEVYKAFFDSYRIDMPGENNPFTDIILVLEEYENTAASLIDNQRDHFVHAVNVFLTGLSIYISNSNYRNAFESTVLNGVYKDCYSTKHEEFFYRWGISSLLHDIGYPIEIVGNQINRFLKIVSDADGEDVRTKARISYSDFDELNSIKKINDVASFTRDFIVAYPDSVEINPLKPIDLMAYRIHDSLGTDLMKTKNDLDHFTEKMAESGFIDHGYFSSIIVLKWYGSLIQLNNFNPKYFYWPVLDSATAILLHNYFKNVIRKGDYNHEPMKAIENPIAYLLILCDEAQEWNRVARGIKTKKRVLAQSVNFSISDDYLALSYTSKSPMFEGFVQDRIDTFYNLLDINSLFNKGLSVDTIASSTINELIENKQTNRPHLDSVERLAIAIHMNYNEKRLKDFPLEELKYPNFSDLPDDMKYSNIRQALGIYDKLDIIGCELKPIDSKAYTLSNDEIEFLAEIEHEDWIKERIESGWTLGDKDVENKKSPYLIPYNELSEEIKDYDRDTIRNIPKIVGLIGLEIRKK